MIHEIKVIYCRSFAVIFLFWICSCLALISEKALALDKVSLQLRWHHQFQFAGYYAAQWQGFYSEEGIEVEIRSAVKDDGEIVSATQAVSDGTADFGVGSADILIALDEGKQLCITASVFQASAAAFFAKQDTRFSGAADFKRLKVARRVNDLIDVEMQAMLRAEGIDPASVIAKPHQAGIQNLIDNEVDVVQGYIISMPFVAKEAGLRLKSIQPASYGIDFYGDSLFTSKKLVEKSPELVKRFTRASIRGWRYALENPTKIASTITELYPRLGMGKQVRHEFNLFQAQEVSKLVMLDLIEVGHINPGRWRRMSELLREVGVITQQIDMTEIIFDPERIEHEQFESNANYLLAGLFILGLAIVLFLIRHHFLKKELLMRARHEQELEKHEIQLEDTNLKLKNMAQTDKLTGVANRMKLDIVLEKELARARRYKKSLSIALFDIDFFKLVNDEHGHQVGDQVLIKVADQINSQLRDTDLCGRWGGEEFLVICPETDINGTHAMAQKIRETIDRTSFLGGIKLTISGGISEYASSDDSDSLLRRADRALYRAKNNGRNRVEAYGVE